MFRRRSVAVALFAPLIIGGALVVAIERSSAQATSALLLIVLVGSLASALTAAVFQEWSAATTRKRRVRITIGIAAINVFAFLVFVPLEVPVRLTMMGMALTACLWSQAPRLRKSS